MKGVHTYQGRPCRRFRVCRARGFPCPGALPRRISSAALQFFTAALQFSAVLALYIGLARRIQPPHSSLPHQVAAATLRSKQICNGTANSEYAVAVLKHRCVLPQQPPETRNRLPKPATDFVLSPSLFSSAAASSRSNPRNRLPNSPSLFSSLAAALPKQRHDAQSPAAALPKQQNDSASSTAVD